jgi:hypothetical protein
MKPYLSGAAGGVVRLALRPPKLGRQVASVLRPFRASTMSGFRGEAHPGDSRTFAGDPGPLSMTFRWSWGMFDR